MNIELIAQVAHQTNKAYCESIGDNGQSDWGAAEEWQRESAIAGVKFQLDHPDANPCHQHENWLADKEKDGWVYGEVKDADKKTHPCCVPYMSLPIEQRIKDSLFVAVVRNMKVLL